LSWFTCVRETARITDGPKKGPGGWKSRIGTQKAQNGEVLKASQKVKATCKHRHPDSSRRHVILFGRYYKVYAHAGFWSIF
jgi:hypothetical protein